MRTLHGKLLLLPRQDESMIPSFNMLNISLFIIIIIYNSDTCVFDSKRFIKIIIFYLFYLFADMKRDIDIKTENVKKMGKQVSTTLKGYDNI